MYYGMCRSGKHPCQIALPLHLRRVLTDQPLLEQPWSRYTSASRLWLAVLVAEDDSTAPRPCIDGSKHSNTSTVTKYRKSQLFAWALSTPALPFYSFCASASMLTTVHLAWLSLEPRGCKAPVG